MHLASDLFLLASAGNLTHNLINRANASAEIGGILYKIANADNILPALHLLHNLKQLTKIINAKIQAVHLKLSGLHFPHIFIKFFCNRSDILRLVHSQIQIGAFPLKTEKVFSFFGNIITFKKSSHTLHGLLSAFDISHSKLHIYLTVIIHELIHVIRIP